MALFSLAELYKGPNIKAPSLPISRPGAFGTGGRAGAGTASQWNAYYNAQRDAKQKKDDWFSGMMDNLEADITKLASKQEGLLDQATGLLGDASGALKADIGKRDELRNYYEGLYRPLSEQFVNAARQGITGDIPGEMARAESDVGQEFAQARDQSTRNLARYGLNPSSGRYVGATRQMDIAEAGARSGARTLAQRSEKRRVEDVGFARLTAGMRSKPSEGLYFGGEGGQLANVATATANIGGIYGNAAAGLGQAADRLAATSGPGVVKGVGNKRFTFLTPLG